MRGRRGFLGRLARGYAAANRAVEWALAGAAVVAGTAALVALLATAAVPGGAGAPRAGDPRPVEAEGPERGGAAALPQASRTPAEPGVGRPVASEEDASEEGASPGLSPADAVLCAPARTLSFAGGGVLGLAADGAGHFALYGAPDAEGRPTEDSYGLLRGCAPELAFANPLSVRVGGEEAVELGAETVAERTRRAASGALVTEHRPIGGVRVRQELRVVGGADRRDALEVRLTLENVSDEPKTADVRSVLAPPPAREGEPVFLAPDLSGLRPEVGGGERVRIERNLLREQLGPLGPVTASRPGAASDSTGQWRPGPEGPPPDRVTLAPWLRLVGTPFFYDVRLGYDLPENSALAAYWTDLRLAPGEPVVVSESYGFPESTGER